MNERLFELVRAAFYLAFCWCISFIVAGCITSDFSYLALSSVGLACCCFIGFGFSFSLLTDDKHNSDVQEISGDPGYRIL